MLPFCRGATLVHASVRHVPRSDSRGVEASGVLICKMGSAVGPCGTAVLVPTRAVCRGAETTAHTPTEPARGCRGHSQLSWVTRGGPSPTPEACPSAPQAGHEAVSGRHTVPAVEGTGLPQAISIYAARHQNQWLLANKLTTNL